MRSTLGHFYCGVSEWNPVLFGVDFKMWLYCAGAVQLQLNVLAFAAAQAMARGSAAGGLPLPAVLGGGSLSFAMAAFVGCMTWFVLEYLWHEHVHLYTYDIFRERIGAKLVWGCLCFYPMFYAMPALPLMLEPLADVSVGAAAACAAAFFAGWVITRGANLQKFAAKQGITRFEFLGVSVPMRTVPGSGGRLLASGFWAVSRHVNYLGETLQAAALAALAWLATGNLWPWLYPLYYLALFIPRELDDEQQCARKYGAAWQAYRKAVPWRIVPGLY